MHGRSIANPGFAQLSGKGLQLVEVGYDVADMASSGETLGSGYADSFSHKSGAARGPISSK